MMDLGITVLLWISAIGCGLMAGLYFAFSTFIMRALGRIEPASGIAAMNAINDTILRSLFMPLFWGTTLASVAIIVAALVGWGEPGAIAMVVGGIVYFVGMFVCTIAFNVPLNNALARAGSAGNDTSTWQRYLDEWTRWNHVRTIACTVACAMFIYAITLRQAVYPTYLLD